MAADISADSVSLREVLRMYNQQTGEGFMVHHEAIPSMESEIVLYVDFGQYGGSRLMLENILSVEGLDFCPSGLIVPSGAPFSSSLSDHEPGSTMAGSLVGRVGSRELRRLPLLCSDGV